MDSIEIAITEQKIRGWEWVTDQLRAMVDEARAERDRLLGPDRGE